MGIAGMTNSGLAIHLFEQAGYARTEPAILQPLEPFLDLSGEDIRRRMFTTQDETGREKCLRPEYTIPVAIGHLAQGNAFEGTYCYAGPVFRIRAGEAGEFVQAGLESFGRRDAPAADAEIMGLAVEAVAALGLASPVVRMGDVAILTGFLDALAVPAPARRRLFRAVAKGDDDPLASLAMQQPSGVANHAGLIAALEGQHPKSAKAFVEDVLSIAGISTVGGRSAGDIAERFLAKAAEKDQRVDDRATRVLSELFTISGTPDEAAERIHALAVSAQLDLMPIVEQLKQRIGFLAARGVDVDAIRFSTRFARNLDYYTGFVFELADPARPDAKPVAGGGRYDGLLQRLGAASPVPAVGVSIWLERVRLAADLERA